MLLGVNLDTLVNDLCKDENNHKCFYYLLGIRDTLFFQEKIKISKDTTAKEFVYSTLYCVKQYDLPDFPASILVETCLKK